MKNKIKLAPSKARIFNMSYPLLIEHNSLIELKKSNLPSVQRKRVQLRVAYLIDKNKISQDEVNESINNLRKSFNGGISE